MKKKKKAISPFRAPHPPHRSSRITTQPITHTHAHSPEPAPTPTGPPGRRPWPGPAAKRPRRGHWAQMWRAGNGGPRNWWWRGPPGAAAVARVRRQGGTWSVGMVWARARGGPTHNSVEKVRGANTSGVENNQFHKFHKFHHRNALRAPSSLSLSLSSCSLPSPMAAPPGSASPGGPAWSGWTRPGGRPTW